MFHRRENNTFKSCLIVELVFWIFFPFLLVNKAINTMPDSSGDFQNALRKKQISALEESGFLALRNLNLSTCFTKLFIYNCCMK